MQYTQIPADTFKNIQLNAGILVDEFTPSTATIGNLIGATTGGVNFTDTPEFVDFGEDIDNCPKNTMELKVLDSRDVVISGTFVTVTAALAKRLSGAADVDSANATHIIPRNDLASTDFDDIWWIGDYSDKNATSTAGYVAIHMMNALSTGGFQIQSTDKEKGQFAFEFTAHTSLATPTTVPYEIYIKEGSAAGTVTLNKSTTSLVVEGTETLTATVTPSSSTVTWASNNPQVATVSSAGLVTGVSAGTATITASITIDGTTIRDTCTVTVTSAA